MRKTPLVAKNAPIKAIEDVYSFCNGGNGGEAYEISQRGVGNVFADLFPNDASRQRIKAIDTSESDVILDWEFSRLSVFGVTSPS